MTTNIIRALPLYFIGEILQVAFSVLLLIPLYSRFFTTNEYADYIQLRAYIELGMYLLFFATSSGFARLYFTVPPLGRNSYTSEFVKTTIGYSVFLIFASYFWQKYFTSGEGVSQLSGYLVAGIIGICLANLSAVTSNLLRNEGKPAHFLALQAGSSVLMAASVSFFLLFTELRADGFLYSFALSNTIALVYIIFRFNKKLIARNFKNIDVRAFARYTWPIGLIYISSFLMAKFNNIFLSENATSLEIGSWGLTQQLLIAITLVNSSFGKIYQPLVFESTDDCQASKRLVRYYDAAIMLLCLILIQFGREIIGIVATQKYAPEQSLINWTVTASYVYSWTVFSDTKLLKDRRSKASLISSLIGAAFAVTGSIIMVPCGSIVGAAKAVFIGSVAYSVSNIYLASPIHYVQNIWAASKKAVLFFMVTILPVQLLSESKFELNSGFRVILLIALSAVVVFATKKQIIGNALK